eukprot:365466_1
MRQNLAHKNNGIVPAFLQDEIIFQSSYVMLEMGFATGHIFDYVFKQLPKYPDWQEIIYHELLSTSSETQSIHSLALIAFIKETMRIAAKAKKFPMLIRPRRVLKDTTIYRACSATFRFLRLALERYFYARSSVPRP